MKRASGTTKAPSPAPPLAWDDAGHEVATRLAAEVAHSLNNALGVVSGTLELILLDSPCANRECLERLAQVRRSSERVAGTTRQLLAFSRRLAPEPIRLDADVWLRETTAGLRKIVPSDVAFVVHSESRRWIEADADQVRQLVEELVANACEAMRSGGTLTISAESIDLDERDAARAPGSRSGAHVAISICDTGPAVDPSALSRFFEPYGRTRSCTRPGLRLAAAAGFARQNGGLVGVASRPGETVVTVYLPAVPAPVTDSGHGGAGEALGHGEVVIVVEDEPVLRRLVCRILANAGYRPLPASTADEAITLYRAEEPIALLLSDVALPGRSGPELAQALRRFDTNLPVLYMSGHSIDPDEHPGAIDRCLAKPFSAARLLQEVRASVASAREASR